MLIEDNRTETGLPTVSDTVNKVMSVETQFRINHDNESYPPLQASAVYAMSEGGYEPTTSTPKKFTNTDFETIKPLNFTPDIKRESDQSHNDCSTPPRERKDSDANAEAELSQATDLNVNTSQPKQHSPSYSDCYTSDSSSAPTPLKWEPTSPQTPVTPGGSYYNQLYPFGLHSPDRERELAFIPRKDHNGVELYFCHLCSFTGTTREVFAAHMSTHFEHSCPNCDYTSRTEGRLKRHIKDFHSSTPPDSYSGNKTPKIMPGRPKVYRCKQCEFVATEKLDFWSHARSHIKDDKLLQCPKCPFVTEYKHHLEYHLRNHFGSKPFKCSKCNYACVNKSMLNSHMKSHTNVYQYRCADCTYATKYCHSLKLHLRKYNHKPATVLNADGSLPQGLDAEAAGLSLMMKRGPPRGPRGPRKDKLEAYLGQLMSMPHLGPRPGMNGLVSPYWPLLGQFPNGFHPPPPLMPIPQGNGMLNCLPHARLPGPGGFPSHQTLTLKCTFCCFSTESRDELTNHMLKVHASDNQDLFNAFGISTDALLEEQSQRKQSKEQRRSTDEAPEDYSRRSPSSSDRPPSHPTQAVSTTESLHIRTDTEDLTKSSPRSWPPTSAQILEKESMNGSKSMPDLSYLSDRKSCDESPNPYAKEDSSDILRQMTLKFGSSAQSAPRETKESPLDLTKPKMIMAANYFAAVKRSYSQMESSEMSMESRSQLESLTYSDGASPSPRKRSRKGKAYKLDTLAWKLQGFTSETNPATEEDINSIGSHDDLDENSDSHYSEKESEFRDLTPRNRGDLNMSEERDDSKEERRLSVAEPSTPNRERTDSFERKRHSFDGRDLEEIHKNLKLLNENEGERKDGMPGEDRCLSPVSDVRRCSMGSNMGMPELPRYSNGDQHTPADIKEQLAIKAAYALKHADTHSSVRKGAEIAWKILHPDQAQTTVDSYQNGSHAQNKELREMPKMFRRHNAFPVMHPEMHHAMKLQEKINGVNGSLYGGSNSKKVPRGNEKFECTYCEIAFGDCVMYTMHMGYHGYKDPYKCNMCGHQSHDKVDFFLHIARAAHA